MLDTSWQRVLDAGDIATSLTTPRENRDAIEAAVRGVLKAGATPLVLGGDDSVPIPVLAAYEQHGPIWIVQVDAHIDWRDERSGERMGWSSPMRRASEMPCGSPGRVPSHSPRPQAVGVGLRSPGAFVCSCTSHGRMRGLLL